jgi:hypothetical protein
MYLVFQLAELLHKTVGELCDTMTEDEINGWVAYFKIKRSRQK